MSFFNTVLEKIKYIKFLKQERGAIFVLTALLLPVVLGCMGFAYDFGNLYMHKARLQNAADAAALTGARAFVDENAAKRKLYKDEYKSSNHVTTIPADAQVVINQNAKADAKAAAKNAAVANVNQNMINLHNNEYQSSYFLITGVIHEAGKDYNQQYFKVNLREMVPLHFLPVIMDKKEQDVAAEAISTIIRQDGGKTSNNNNHDHNNGGIESLFMIKSGMTVESAYDSNGNAPDANGVGGNAPTWSGSFTGDLRYTGDVPSVSFHQSDNGYENKPYDKIFNKKAWNLVQKFKPLKESGYNESDFNEFVNELKKNSAYYDGENLTQRGASLVNTIENYLKAGNKSYAYNALYDELASNKYYYSSFSKIDYSMDTFGNAVKTLFEQKLATLRNTADDKIPEYLEDKAAWDAANNNLTEEQLTAAYNAALAKYQEDRSKTPKDIYNLLLPYHNRADGWNIAEDVWSDYVAAGSPGGIPDYDNFKRLLTGNWSDEGKNYNSWDVTFSSWVWNDIKRFFLASVKEPNRESIKADLIKIASGGLTHEPVPAEYKPAAGDTYYAQYNGNQQSWTASEISKNLNSREHSYFCYNGKSDEVAFTIDEAGFYTGTGIGADDPFYIFIAKDVSDIIRINLNADVNRPLVFCYMGTNNPKIHIQLNGHTFRGVIYTPNSSGTEVHMNLHGSNGSKGTFKGTWMSDTIHLKQGSGHYEYVDYELDESLEKAWPGYSEDNSSGNTDDHNQENQEEEETDKNWIKVIKLVKRVENIKEIEEIE